MQRSGYCTSALFCSAKATRCGCYIDNRWQRFQEEKQDRFGMSEPNEHFALDNISAHCTWIKRSVETTAAIHYIGKFVKDDGEVW